MKVSTGMASEVTIPRLGWNMDEGIFVGWLKADGQHVAAGEPLFSLEGDKATQDVESLETGILCIAPDGPKDGEKIAVGTLIGYLIAPGETPPFEADSARSAAVNRVTQSRDCEAPTEPERPAARPEPRPPGTRPSNDDV
jgi:pyruvate dehydrogenase E2 component (dihydrolipoamide acetyltransferase)